MDLHACSLLAAVESLVVTQCTTTLWARTQHYEPAHMCVYYVAESVVEYVVEYAGGCVGEYAVDYTIEKAA